MVSQSGLTPYEYRINGIMLIRKVSDGFIAFVSGKRLNKKESDAATPLPANLIWRSGNSPALLYPMYEQSN